MKNKLLIPFVLFFLFPLIGISQSNTTSPYSRYGIGEMNQKTLAHNTAMGGAHIALRPDSTMPVFINVGNPAAYSLIRMTSLEVGGEYKYSNYTGANRTTLTKWGTSFAYAVIGFPIRRNGGACLGVQPLSSVGYAAENRIDEENIGNVTYKYAGSGGLSKAFLGYGFMPFKNRLIKFRSKHFYLPDSLKTLSSAAYRRKETGSKLLSDFSVGFNGQYIFGDITNSTRIVYPNNVKYNNTYRAGTTSIGDFSGNFGMQTALTIDSVNSSTAGYKRALKEKVKITFGYFLGLNSTLKGEYSTTAYNYILNGFGQEIVRDTVFVKVNESGNIKLPLEQGFGIGFKKGERINAVADFAITQWSQYRSSGELSNLVDNYRMAIGVNFVPEKYAAGRGSYGRRVNYRLGASYQSGYIKFDNSMVTDYFVSLGFGLPVGIGRMSSMINVSGQYGIMGSNNPNLIKEKYFRINFGFTFCDRWFQKFRYD